MEDKNLKLDSERLRKEKKFKRILRIILLIIFLLLLAVFLVFGIIYNAGNFTITLDPELYYDRDLIIYDDPTYKVYRPELYAPSPEEFNNTSYKWFDWSDITQRDGSHNGDNYLAYTFYIENIGTKWTDFYYEIVIDDVIKNVDEAVRIRLYTEEEYVTYAKAKKNGTPEKDTVAFLEDEIVCRERVNNFGPGEKKKYTLVMWVEGTDTECTDNILGGEFKAHMQFNSEIIEK